MILTIAKKEFRSLFSAPSTWWMLALMQFLFAWFYFGRLNDYLLVQAQLSQLSTAPGATIAVAAPVCSVLALMLMMLIPLFTMRLIAAISAMGLSFGLWLLEMIASDNRGFLRSISPNAHFQNLNMGLVNSADLIYFVLFISTLLLLTIRHLNNERHNAS